MERGAADYDRCELFGGRLTLAQPRRGYRFSLDAILLGWWVKFGKGDMVLDAGCGVGVVALLLACCRGAADVTGLELQDELAALARENVRLNGAGAQVKIERGDIRALPPSYRERFDVFCANPPFREAGAGRTNPQPARALARHEPALTLTDLARAAAFALRRGGQFFLVHQPRRLTDIVTSFRDAGVPVRTLRAVHPRSDAAANLVLVAGAKGPARECRVLPPLVVYGRGREYGAEVAALYAGEGKPLYRV